jgi:hypothetical protein
MRFGLLLFILLATSFQALAYELMTIQSVSSTKKTFITRNGKRQGLIRGMTATFTADDVSILAKLVNLSGNFSQWQIVNSEAIVPFENGSIVTYYAATEYLWALQPEKERSKMIKRRIEALRQSWLLKGAFTRGLSESVSETPSGNTKRGGYLAEAYYERDILYGLAFDVGYRYENEVVNYTGATYTTRRSMIIGDLLYYFNNLQDVLTGRPYVGLGFGYGFSNTQSSAIAQSGPVALLPVAKVGITMPFNDDWEALFDASFESLQTAEKAGNGRSQTTTQTNFKGGFGLRRFF